MNKKLQNIINKSPDLDFEDISYLLSLEKKEDIIHLKKTAEKILLNNIGNKVSLRGLVEFSNICTNDCEYCGIRKSNSKFERFFLDKKDIISCINWAIEKQFGSIVLQSGERQDEKFIDFVEDIIKYIKLNTISNNLPNGLGVTLSVGEQTYETYKRFFDAGAHRYLLRIETSNPKLYKLYHPEPLSFENRLICLAHLKNIGYQLGTGVLIGLPQQSIEDLSRDVLFFKKLDVDMLGMGPFIPHKNTKLFNVNINTDKQFLLGLKMISVSRLVMQDINIASTTALETLNANGRTIGLTFGANVVMPQLTPITYKNKYLLYDNKPGVDELQDAIFEKMQLDFNKIGRKINFNNWGDSLHFSKMNF